jgi:hypothetical protein
MSNILDAALIFNKETAAAYKNDKFDVLFVREGPLLFCEYRDAGFELIKNATKVIFIKTSFNFPVDKKLASFCRNKYGVWSSVPSMGTYVNWCKLSWKPIQFVPRSNTIKGLFYYGTFREDRVGYFHKYFSASSQYEILISTYGKSAIKFIELNNKIRIVEQFKNTKQIANFQCSLYIEDVFSHTNYCSPANRFFESLSVGLPMLFDESCVKTFDTFGIDARDFVVSTTAEVKKEMLKSEQIREKQHKLWARDYYSEFVLEFKKTFEKEVGPLETA